MRTMTLTCETEGCPNRNLAIDLETDANQYMCGACGQLITNAVEKTNGSTEETE
jgi:hypothetical protein